MKQRTLIGFTATLLLMGVAAGSAQESTRFLIRPFLQVDGLPNESLAFDLQNQIYLLLSQETNLTVRLSSDRRPLSEALDEYEVKEASLALEAVVFEDGGVLTLHVQLFDVYRSVAFWTRRYVIADSNTQALESEIVADVIARIQELEDGAFPHQTRRSSGRDR